MILKGLITKIKLRNFLVSNLLPVAPSTINEGFPWPPTWKVFGLLALFAVFGCPIENQRLVGIQIGVDIGISAVRVDFL